MDSNRLTECSLTNVGSGSSAHDKLRTIGQFLWVIKAQVKTIDQFVLRLSRLKSGPSSWTGLF